MPGLPKQRFCLSLAGSLILIVTFTLGCARSRVVPTAPPAGVTDPVSDVHFAVGGPRAPRPPDLVSGTAQVKAGEIRFTIRFVRGTFDPRTTRHNIDLDTDEGAATGVAGLDYIVYVGTSAAPRVPLSAFVQRQPDRANVGAVSARVVSDGFDVTIPLALLGNDDGRMTFRVRSYASDYTGQDFDSSTVDFMPDRNLPPGLVR